MRSFKKLLTRLEYLNKRQIKKIEQAFIFANLAHAEQKRVSGESYILHPLSVASYLADMHMDTQTIIASLLHDIIEDTEISKKTITQKFGKIVADLVDGVTKLGKMNFSSTAEVQAESFRKMIMAMAADIRVIIIKLADRVHNMRTIGSLPAYKRHRIAKETLDIYAPIANRLGMHEIYIEIANLAFGTLHPTRYKVIQDTVKKTRGNRKGIMKTIDREIKKQFAKSKLPKPIVLGREKHIYSIYRKMRQRHLSFSEIMDVYGFRIIVGSVDDCYRALGVVHNLYMPVPGKFKDYIAIPKANGYQSLHTTLFGPHALPLEIQIRTTQMNQIADKGIAAHWLYKADEQIDQAHARAQQWINDLLELQQKTGSSLEFVENVKTNLFPDEIYVFTPKGGILELPLGSTIVDFAYAIHTDVGNSCASARIDKTFAPLSTILKSGQTISVTTSPEARPNPAWLNFVKTAKAKSAIRYYLKRQKTSEAVALGKQLLTAALKEISPTDSRMSKRAMKTVLETNSLPSIEDLYATIGLGKKMALLMAHQLVAASRHTSMPQQLTTQTEPLLIKDTQGIAITLANCCNPIPGDLIVGCLITGKGLLIHRENCPKIATARQQPEKCVLVSWAEDISNQFPAVIQVEILSQPDSFAKITKKVSELNINLEDIKISRRTGESYIVTLKLLVQNTKHLNNTMHHLRKLPIVVKVSRVE